MQYLNCSFKSLLLKLPFIVKYSVGKINVQSDYKDNKDYLVRLFIVRYGIIKLNDCHSQISIIHFIFDVISLY